MLDRTVSLAIWGPWEPSPSVSGETSPCVCAGCSSPGATTSPNRICFGIAVEIKEPKGYGWCRMAPLADASSASLHPLVTDHVEPGATVITDGWQGTEDWTGSAMVTTRGVSARLRPAEKTEQAAARCAPRRLAGQAMAPGAPPGLWRSVRSTPRRSGAVQALAAPDEGGPIDIEVHAPPSSSPVASPASPTAGWPRSWGGGPTPPGSTTGPRGTHPGATTTRRSPAPCARFWRRTGSRNPSSAGDLSSSRLS
jgi:hypothetical protein